MNAADDRKKTPPTEPPAAKEAPAKKSAMKLPPGVTPASSRGPQARRPWETGRSGQPQPDAARRKGKSRKVH